MASSLPAPRTGEPVMSDRAVRSALVRADRARRQAATFERRARIRPSVALLYAGEARRLRVAARQWELDARYATN